MSPEGSITHWIAEIKDGDSAGARGIWERYFPQLVRVARQRLNCRQDPVADEEDIALSVLESFFEGAQNNRFPNLRDRDGLWRLLSEMTRRKAIDYRRVPKRRGNTTLRGPLAAGGVWSDRQRPFAAAGTIKPAAVCFRRQAARQSAL
jgi:DNA-directed RNA polymerase specialized sigma24 family protein